MKIPIERDINQLNAMKGKHISEVEMLLKHGDTTFSIFHGKNDTICRVMIFIQSNTKLVFFCKNEYVISYELSDMSL